MICCAILFSCVLLFLQNMSEITVGNHAIVKKVDGGHVRVVKVTKNKLVLIEKLKLYLDNAVGSNFGSVFDVRDRQLFKVDSWEPDDDAGEEVEGKEQSPSAMDCQRKTHQYSGIIVHIQ